MIDRKIEDCNPEYQSDLDKAITDSILDFLAGSGVAFGWLN